MIGLIERVEALAREVAELRAELEALKQQRPAPPRDPPQAREFLPNRYTRRPG